MAYTYRIIGLAGKFSEFNQVFTNKLTESGIEITNKKIGVNSSEFNVKSTDETGWIKLAVQGSDILATFDTEKSPERKTLEAARVGLRFLGTVLSGGSVVDATVYSAEESFNYALSGAGGALASTIASCIRSTESELREKLMIAPETPQIPSIEDSEYNTMLVDVESRLISLKEETKILKEAGKNVNLVELRISRAEKLVEEAKELKKSGNVVEALARLRAANSLLDRAESSLSTL